MIILTEGLKSLTGNKIHKALLKFTHNPSSGALFGTISTAILQSSSATTVAAVGFVRAGLISFPEALGIIFGANIGTTITGWLVALLGFKLKLGLLLMPMVLIGTALKLFCKNNLANAGFALAGFGLIFVGIGNLQESLQGLHHIISFENFPADSFPARLQLVVIGVAFTIITQSSSLGVATTLTALNANMMNFEQAMALVIGIDVGTTITAVIATIGGTPATKRTGWSHVTYNVITATIAFFLITPFIFSLNYLSPTFISSQAEISLVAFHSFFNILGVMTILPFTRQFSSFMQWMIPDKKASSTLELEKLLIKEPALALNETKLACLQYFKNMIQSLAHYFDENKKEDFFNNSSELNKIQSYLNKIKIENIASTHFKQYISLTHTLDHMDRLYDRLEEQDRMEKLLNCETLLPIIEQFKKETLSIIENLAKDDFHSAHQHSKALAEFLTARKLDDRNQIMSQKAQGKLDDSESQISLEAIRWSERTSHHLSRICFYLEEMTLQEGKMT